MKYSTLKNAEHTVYVDEYDKDGKKVFVLYLLLTFYSISFRHGNYSGSACYSIVSAGTKHTDYFFGCSLQNKLNRLDLMASLEAINFRKTCRGLKPSEPEFELN